MFGLVFFLIFVCLHLQSIHFFDIVYSLRSEMIHLWTYLSPPPKKQAVAELCQAQVMFRLDSDFLGEDLYMFIQKLDQEIKRLKGRPTLMSS